MTELGPTFKIPKTTGTHADVFLAVGLADLLSSAVDDGPVTIHEDETYFIVNLPRPLFEKDISRFPQDPGYPFLQANKNVSVPAGAVDPVDYKVEKAKADRIKKIRDAVSKGKQRTLDSDTQQLIQEEQQRGDWRLLQVLNTLQGDETSNRVHRAIVGESPKEFRQNIALALKSLSGQGSHILKWEVSLVQLFTPLAAKGYSRLKPDSTGRNDKTKEQWADPFSEWLKYRGYFRVACPFFQGSKAEDVRVLCPIPGHISIRALSSLGRELPKFGIYGSAPKMDSLAVLRLAELLITRSEE
ncbi:MAG: hypothetical protein AAB037_00665, partial [Chloroflexota bacterium]